MKKLLGIIFMFLYIDSQGQDSVQTMSFGAVHISTCEGDINHGRGAMVCIDDKDSTMTISGDTMKVIKYLLVRLRYYEKELSHYMDIIQTSVEFSNEVPNIWKSPEHNCKWSAYSRAIGKLGYRTVTKKNNKLPCR